VKNRSVSVIKKHPTSSTIQQKTIKIHLLIATAELPLPQFLVPSAVRGTPASTDRLHLPGLAPP